MMNSLLIEPPIGYDILRPLSLSSAVFLCRESASDRLLVIKFFPPENLKGFENEVYALKTLTHFSAVPTLYFAQKQKNGMCCVGMQHRLGKSLTEFKEKLNTESVAKLRIILNELVTDLHQKWSLSHGDLSPKNILLFEKSIGKEWEVSFIDWEFSMLINKQTLSTYNQYRGTLGFGEEKLGSSSLAVTEKDRKAIEDCLAYAASQNNIPSKKRIWIPKTVRLFSKIQ